MGRQVRWGIRGFHRGLGLRWVIGMSCSALCGTLALGQPAFNRGKPTVPPTPAKVTPPEPPPPQAPTDQTAEGTLYRVARFTIRYGTSTAEIEDAFNSDKLPRIHVALEKRGNEYHALPPSGKPTSGERVEFALGEFDSPDAMFSKSALRAISETVVHALNAQDVFGVRAMPDSHQIDSHTDKDLRAGKTDLDYMVYVGRVGQVRTISGGGRNTSLEDRVNLERVRRIAEDSPVKVPGVIRKGKLDEYAIRASRHPGRRVDIAASPLTDKPGEVNLDFLISEEKPWTVYGQVSNTGTEATSKWRERFGLIHGDLTGNDDVLKLDYTTANFDASHAVSASYEFPIVRDTLKVRVFGDWNRFVASDVGFAGREFTGESWDGGAELDYLFYQHREWFFDAIGGIRYQSVKATDRIQGTLTNATANFLYPYVGFTLDRDTEEASTHASAYLEYQTGGVGTDASKVALLGRTNPDTQWTVVKLSADHSFYIEPLLRPSAFRGVGLADGQTWQSGMTLSHEMAFSFRSQIALGDRLIPNAMQTAGGMYSVRGYPESVSAGDTNFIGSAEYRFHLPRAFRPRPEQSGFRWVPPTTYGRADWDLIFKAFVDVGRTQNSKIEPALETNSTLVGAGVGTELQFSTPFKASLRVDWGIALKDVADASGRNVVDKGDNRLHVSLTVLY